MAENETAYSRREANRYDERRFRTDAGRLIHAREYELLQRALRDVPRQGRMAEFGCGTGRLLLPAMTAFPGMSGVGIDASPHMLAELRGRGDFAAMGDRLEVVHCNATDVPLEDGEFDVCYSIRLLNQVASPEVAHKVIHEMFRVAKPGGIVLCEFKNADRPGASIHRRQSPLLNARDVLESSRRAGHGVHLWTAGAFFLGMTAYHRVVLSRPLSWVDSLDRELSLRFPGRCSRVYVAMQKAT